MQLWQPQVGLSVLVDVAIQAGVTATVWLCVLVDAAIQAGVTATVWLCVLVDAAIRARAQLLPSAQSGFITHLLALEPPAAVEPSVFVTWHWWS